MVATPYLFCVRTQITHGMTHGTSLAETLYIVKVVFVSI